MRSALIRLSHGSGASGPSARVSQLSTSAARRVFQPLTPTLRSPQPIASSIAAAQDS
jgi:hypothetical protein